MKTTKSSLLSLKFVRANSFCLILLFIINSFIGCSVSKPVYPKDRTAIEENIPLESFSGHYNTQLLAILGSDSYKQEYLSKCVVDFWIVNGPELKFRLKCNDDIDSKNNPSFSLVNPNERVEIKNNPSFSLVNPDKRVEVKLEKGGILINYQDFKADAWGFESTRDYALLFKAKDGSLIVKKGTLRYGAVFWIIPAEWKEEYVWYRFKGNNVDIRGSK